MLYNAEQIIFCRNKRFFIDLYRKRILQESYLFYVQIVLVFLYRKLTPESLQYYYCPGVIEAFADSVHLPRF